MKKIFFYFTCFCLAIGVFIFIEHKQKLELIERKNNEIERLIKVLEKVKIAGIVECDNEYKCSVKNGVSRYFAFSKLDIENFDSLILFLKNIDIKSANIKQYLNNSLNDITTKNVENNNFSININNLDFKDMLDEDFSFLTWYIKQDTYKEILKNMQNININLQVKFNNKDNINIKDFYLQIDFLDANIKILLKNEELQLKIKNYDFLKTFFLEFKNILKKLLEKNNHIPLANEMLEYFDVFTSDDIFSFTLIAKNINKPNDVVLIYKNKLTKN